jgi:hypothetical protein
MRKRINVGDVAVFAPAEFDPDGVDQREAVNLFDAADTHLERDPSAERGAHQRHLPEPLPVEQVEIEISEIVNGAEPVRSLGAAETRMAGDKNAPSPRQQVEERPVFAK